MTQDRRITDKLPGHPLQWDDSASPSAAPAAGQAGLGIPEDFLTHQSAWRKALEIARFHAAPRFYKDDDQKGYWEHELKAFDRAYSELLAAPVAASSRDMLIAEAVRNECLSAAHDADPKHEIRRIDLAAIVSKVSAPVAADTEQAADYALLAECRAVFDLMLDGCNEQKFGDYQNGHGEEIGPRMDALHAKLRALPADAGAAPILSGGLTDDLIYSIAGGNGMYSYSYELNPADACRRFARHIEREVLARLSTPGAPVTAEHMCATCKDTGIVYTGPIGDPPEQCEACFDQEPAVTPAPVTAEPAQSIDTPEFCDLITELHAAHDDMNAEASKKAWAALVAHIDSRITTPAPADRDALAQAIHAAAVKRGIIHADTAVSGPQLAMLCNDLASPADRDAIRAEALEEAERIAESYGPNRPIVAARPSDIIRGRWEGEQAASSNIARLIRDLKVKSMERAADAKGGAA